jgi:predicted dehydrogenase
MNILLIGAGRMGLRHLSGLTEGINEIYVVDLRSEAEKDILHVMAEHNIKANLHFNTLLNEIPFSKVKFDAAIISATAKGRCEQFRQVAINGIKSVLIEKPIEQSREKFEEIRKITKKYKLNVWCNHYRRSLPFFSEIQERKAPIHIVVTGGAFGLGCVGIHLIDFTIYLTNSRKGWLLFGEVDKTKILSGRGKEFRDFGGCGVFSFEDGSRLYLNSAVDSSAPMIITITQLHQQYIIDQQEDLAIIYERKPSSVKPNYLYGVDYTRREVSGIEHIQFKEITKNWILSLKGATSSPIPTLDEASLGHELLFDLLETTGKKEFAIT